MHQGGRELHPACARCSRKPTPPGRAGSVVEFPFQADAAIGTVAGIGFEGDVREKLDFDARATAFLAGSLLDFDVDLVVDVFAGFDPAFTFLVADHVEGVDLQDVADLAESIEAAAASEAVQGKGELAGLDRADFAEFAIEQEAGENFVLG